jgi:hypothetical protein
MTRLHTLSIVLALAGAACSTSESPRPGEESFARIAVVDDGAQATVRATDASGREVSRALLRRDHEVARVEVEIDGGRFVAELEPVTGEIVVHAEGDDATMTWSPSSGEAMPAAIEARWSDITLAWRNALLDDDAKLRPDLRAAINVPSDLFAPAAADVPVAPSLWCPEPTCWYDVEADVEICHMLHQVWCPPPPEPEPCGGWCPPEPCYGFYCPDPCYGVRCEPPCVGLWCQPPCWGIHCGCDLWDPYCEY